MASGDSYLFNAFYFDALSGVHALGSDEILVGLINSTVTPSVDDLTPKWTDYSANEAAPKLGNYTGPVTLANVTITLDNVNADVMFDCDDYTINTTGVEPTDARWGIVFNNTAANKEAIGFIDLGSIRNLSIANITFEFAINGFFEGGAGTLT